MIMSRYDRSMRPGIAAALILVAACSSRGRLALLPPAPLPSMAAHLEPQPREDSPDEAMRYYLMKRAPDGQNLPVERLLDAQRQV